MEAVMPKVIVTHPNNLELLKRASVVTPLLGYPSVVRQDFRIQANQHMEIDKPTGRFVLPNGLVVNRYSVKVSHRFVEYGPEDIELLLFARVIREERTPLFYVYDDSNFSINFNFKFKTQRSAIASCFS
jgi:hypothetical protein